MNGNILYLSTTYPGSVHDKTLCEEEKFSFSKKVLLWLDLGFYGWKIENVHLIMPHKKPKGGELTDEQKEYNRWVSKMRVRVEHVIASIKHYRIVKETFRGRLYNKEDAVMLIACGLHNFRNAVRKNLIQTYS